METNRDRSTLISLPYDVIANISLYLDLVSNTSLMDTCQYFRYMYLSSKYIWRSIWFELNHSIDLHRTYSSLRKLGDSNGLNQLVKEVNMDGCDDSHFSPLVMLIKFPNLQLLSASNRPENTNLEIDIKLLQEMLIGKTIKAGELALSKLNIYNYQMDYEIHFSTYQKLWNKLSKSGHVELDIKPCQYTIENDLETRISQLDINNASVVECRRIIKKGSQCWSCGYKFNSCWKCESICKGCQLKRIPPLPNDNQIKLKKRKHWPMIVDNKADEDEFSVFN